MQNYETENTDQTRRPQGWAKTVNGLLRPYELSLCCFPVTPDSTNWCVVSVDCLEAGFYLFDVAEFTPPEEVRARALEHKVKTSLWLTS